MLICLKLCSLLIFFFFPEETRVTFEVKIYKEEADIEAKNNIPTGCSGEVKFVHHDQSEETVPLLIVYSHDPKILQINYKQIAERAINRRLIQTTEAETTPSSRHRRAVPDEIEIEPTTTEPTPAPIPGCGIQPLEVKGSDIFHDMIAGADPDNFEVLFPPTFNAGICGGRCASVIPDSGVSNHAPFIYLLLQKSEFRERHNFEYKQFD